MARVSINPDAARMAREEVSPAMRRLAAEIAEDARSLAPSRTGTLRDSIGHYQRRDGVHVVYASAPHAHLIEFGTDPHEISPREGQALAIPGGGVYRRVHHPGTTARPFLRPAAYRNRGSIR